MNQAVFHDEAPPAIVFRNDAPHQLFRKWATQGQPFGQQLELACVVAHDRLDYGYGSLMPVVNNRRCLFDGGPQLSVALAKPTVKQLCERSWGKLPISHLFDRALPLLGQIELGP